MMESSLLKFSLEETQQIVAMIQEIINKIKVINKRIIHLEDQLERVYPSDRIDKSIGMDIDMESIELLASSLVVDSALATTHSSVMEEYIPDTIVVQSAEDLVAAPQLATNDSLPAVRHHTKETRKQHACVNRLTVLELFAPMAFALHTGIGSQHKLWKPGLSSA